MAEIEEETCPICHGRGSKDETYTTTETDYASGIALGAALGMGFFPSTKAVTKTRTVTCPKCGGGGKIRRR